MLPGTQECLWRLVREIVDNICYSSYVYICELSNIVMTSVPFAKRRWNAAVSYSTFDRIQRFAFENQLQLQQVAENLFSQLPDDLFREYGLRRAGK